MESALAENFDLFNKQADFWALYILEESQEELSFRSGFQEPTHNTFDKGALITVVKNGGIGYASTQSLSAFGLNQAFLEALAWAKRFSDFCLFKDIGKSFQAHQGVYYTLKETPSDKINLKEKLDLLKAADDILRFDSRIVDSSASLWSINSHTHYYNSLGADLKQEIYRIIPALSATANDKDVTQVRTLGGMRAYCRQGGFESILNLDLIALAESISNEAIELVYAPNCPSGVMDALIAPDQMMLQIHESIGHPLELDRILGDERNYAGTSFVSLDMFGSYQYGSELLNVSFDPSLSEEFASYGYDDEGSKAEKVSIIENGLLLRPLGAAVSEKRAGMAGVANARSSSWNRPPIDRMANLNIEAGQSSFEDMIKAVEKGIYLRSNSSWSIDDSRNKFQFGCEWGQLIEKGELTRVVRNPNYRGISASFWRSLSMVGNKDSLSVMGTPYCGKGEPNQCIKVGHASPACLFTNIDVFGGEQ
jgi:predicted Zn-dependent protease